MQRALRADPAGQRCASPAGPGYRGLGCRDPEASASARLRAFARSGSGTCAGERRGPRR